MNYRIRYPGSRPRNKSSNPSGPKTHHNWMRSGTKLAGLHIAGQCIVCLLIFGFGLSVIGGLALVMSASTEITDRRQSTPPAIVGCVFLSTGASILFIGLLFFCCAAKRAKMRLLREQSARPIAQEASEGPRLAVSDSTNSVDPTAPADQAVYYISDSRDTADPTQFSVQNSAYIPDNSELDEGFKGFTYSDVGNDNKSSAPTGEPEQENFGSLPRPLPNRLPPINRDTGYSTLATFGRTETSHLAPHENT